jgi:hypothetical protein
MKKIGYIIYCIIIIVISITINVFIGNSDRKLDYIMNDVIEHFTCEEEETCVSDEHVNDNDADEHVNDNDAVDDAVEHVNDESGVVDNGENIDYPYFEAKCDNMNTKHYMDKSLQSLIDDGCLIGIKANDIFPVNFDDSLESGNVKNYCKDRVFTNTWSSPSSIIDNS